MTEAKAINPLDWLHAVNQSNVSGHITSSRRKRFKELFEENPDPDPIELYEAWNGETPQGREAVASASAGRLADDSDTGDFDPKTDDARNHSHVRVKSVYNDALEAGFNEEAEYLRSIAHTKQAEFARFLRVNYLEGDLQERAWNYEPDEREAERLKEF